MALTPSTLRLDLKCGKGSISKGEKCSKGPASQASLTENILKFGGAAGVVGSLAYAMRPNANVFSATAGMNASIGSIASGVAMEGARTKNRRKQLLATSIASSNFAMAAFNGYAAHSTGGGRTGNAGTRNVGSNKAVPNPYGDLGIPKGASDAEIKRRWLTLMRENHPDVGGDPRKAQRINAAYQEIQRRRGKLDSIYADGFHIDWEALTL